MALFKTGNYSNPAQGRFHDRMAGMDDGSNPAPMPALDEGAGASRGKAKSYHVHHNDDGTAHSHIHHGDDTHEHTDHASAEEAHDHVAGAVGDNPEEERMEGESATLQPKAKNLKAADVRHADTGAM